MLPIEALLLVQIHACLDAKFRTTGQEKQDQNTKLTQEEGEKISAEHLVVVRTWRYQARSRAPRASSSAASCWSVLNVHDAGDLPELSCGEDNKSPTRPLATRQRQLAVVQPV
jgi:hypothetical protein